MGGIKLIASKFCHYYSNNIYSFFSADNLVFLTYLVLYFWPCVKVLEPQHRYINIYIYIQTARTHRQTGTHRQTDNSGYLAYDIKRKRTVIEYLLLLFSLLRGKYGAINTSAVEGRSFFFLGLSYIDDLFMHQRR